MEALMICALFAVPLLLQSSFFLLLEWHYFWRFVTINILLFTVYILIIYCWPFAAGERDDYDLAPLFVAAAAVMTHVMLGFLFAVAFRLRRRFFSDSKPNYGRVPGFCDISKNSH
jgi:hypothetical protein